MMRPYKKAYSNSQNSKKLYYSEEDGIRRSEEVVKLWRSIIAKDAKLVDMPIMVPIEYLKKTGHWKEFKDELFLIQENEKPEPVMALRPETVLSIFPHIKQLGHTFGFKDLKLAQKGLAFRNEKSTRDGTYRMTAFNQMEMVCLIDVTKQDIKQQLEELKKRAKQFFESLNVTVEFRQLSETQRCHYSEHTWDLYVKVKDNEDPIEVGCINNRGTNDLYMLSEVEKCKYKLIEISLGLDRIVKSLGLTS